MAICDRSCVKPLLSGFLILLTDSRFLLLFSRLLIPSHIFLILNKLVSKYLWKCSFLLKRVNVRIWYRGYYTVTQRYEFYFRAAKQYFTNERSEWAKYCFCHEKIKFISWSRSVMFFLLYRQKGIDKIIEGKYRNYVIDKLTCEIMENEPLGSRM